MLPGDTHAVSARICLSLSTFDGGHMARSREIIEPTKGDKRYIRRDTKGRFTTDQVDVGRSLSADRKRNAKRSTRSGHGDKGDRKRS